MAKINGSNIEYVRVEKIPLDLECWSDLASGNGIRLTSVESFDKKNQKIPTGLQSDFFGTDFSSDYAFKERWSCKCGKYMGKSYRGMICDRCGSKVEYQDIDLNRFGWVILDSFEVMSPIMYAKFSEALGKIDNDTVLRLILARRYEEEFGDKEYNDKELAILAKHPFSFKGMIWLRKHVHEVIDYYRRKKPGKAKLFDELENDQSLMWTHSIPVYTSLLRTEIPGEKGSKNFKLKINTHFRSLIRTSNDINTYTNQAAGGEARENLDYQSLNFIDILLASMQKDIDAVFETTYNDLTDKTGVITSKVLGGRYNFSARDIIVPNSGELRSDEVIIGYIPFMELYRYELQNEYRKITGCTPGQANSAWKRATNRFDEKFYAIIEHMTSNPEYSKYLGVLINRNPSINYGSFDYVRIVKVQKDINDKTLTIPTHIITPMNADFDGDLLNVFRIIGMDFQKRFEKNMNPRYNLFVSRMNGKVNKEVMPVKDELTAFWAFNQ